MGVHTKLAADTWRLIRVLSGEGIAGDEVDDAARNLIEMACDSAATWYTRQPGATVVEDFRMLASAMRKLLPPILLADVIAHLDPLTPFVEFLRAAEGFKGARDICVPREPGHILAEAMQTTGTKKTCSACGGDHTHWHVHDYDPIWREGKVICECGTFIRSRWDKFDKILGRPHTWSALVRRSPPARWAAVPRCVPRRDHRRGHRGRAGGS